MSVDYTRHFPHPEIRPQQLQAINFVIDAFVEKGKRFVILEAGTGVGKSAVGVTIGRYLNDLCESESTFEPGSYFVTTQKILQEQYVNDFGTPNGNMRSVKSSSNYDCKYHKKKTCKESQQMLRTADKGSRFFKACAYGCIYKEEKKKFLESCESVTNFPYFLTEAAFSRKITPRQCLVIDEAHNIESELSKFIEINASERFCKSVLNISWPQNVSTQFQAYTWIRDIYYPKARSRLAYFEGELERSGLKERLKDFEKVARQYDLLKSHVSKIKTFLEVYDKDNWVFDLIPSYQRSMRKFSFKPIDISKFAKELSL